jgi:hypothetical protein
MDTVKDQQEITIGRYKCKVVNLNKDWWCNSSLGRNEYIYTQFGLTRQDICNILGYECSGNFPECKSAEDLTKVIKFILSKETKPVISLETFPTDGCFRFDGVHNDDIIKHLESINPSGVKLYNYHIFVAWNNSSYWFCQNSGKVEYNWEQLSKFVTTKKEVVKEKQSDYVGRTIKALIQNPQGTGVQLGEEIKILKQTGSHYVLDKTAKGIPGMWIKRPLYTHEWELLPETQLVSSRFTPGKWYAGFKDPDKIAAKFSEISSGGNFGFSEFIRKRQCHNYYNGNWAVDQGIYELTDLSSIQDYLPTDHPEKVKQGKSNFIPGAWYKWDSANWYFKYSRSEGEHWWFSEAIKDGDYHFGQDWSHITNNHILVDVADMQKYLPDGHPERTFKSRFKIGDWIMWDGTHKGGPYKLTSISGTGFLDQNDDYRDTEDYHYRLATRSEIPEKMLDRDIPEYVECISKDFYAIHLGRIYKLDPRSTSDNYHLKDVNVGTYSPRFFKPSTKEAYNAQFKTTSILPKKWCVKITSSNKEVLNRWRKRQPNFNESTVGFTGWLLSDAYDGTYTHWGVTVPTSYTEITLQQFYDNVYHIDVYDIIKKESSVYGYDPYETIKTKPLIEDVQSVSVKLSTKRKINKFKN